MTQYIVQAPDGSKHIIEGPDQTAPQQQAPAPQPGPQSAGGDLGGSLYAGVHGFADMATFGQGDKVAAAASALTESVSRAIGLPIGPNENYSQNLQDIQQRSQQAAAAHPIANAAGEVAGILPGGALAGRVLAGAGRAVPAVARVADALAPVANQPLTNVAKSVAVNAGVGGAAALANGDSLPQAAQTAAITGVAGPIVGKGVSFALDKLAPAAQRAYMLLADKFGMKPQELQSAIQNYQQITNGATPSLAGLANLKAQGRLAELAKANPTIGDAAAQASNPALMTPAQQGIVKIATGGGPQTASDLFDLRKTNMDSSMAQIRNTPVPFTQRAVNTLTDPLVTQALRENARNLGNSSTLGKVEAYVQSGPSGSHLTLDDIDNIRESLRNRQDVYDNPQSNNHDRFVAREYGQAAQNVENLGVATHPDYGQALQQYKSDSDYLNGFQHGTSGKPMGEAKPGSPTAFSLTRPQGQAGYAHGNQLARSQGAVDTIAPSHVAPQATFPGPQHVAQAGMAAASGGTISAIYHGFKAIPVLGDRVPEPVQQKLAAMLFDPRQTAQAVNFMRKAGVDAQSIRRAGALAGAGVSARVADYLSKQGQ